MGSDIAYSVVVTDLDDTLFDWVGIWHKCFSAMLQEVLKISGLDRERVCDDFKRVHQKHGTTEYAFALEELDCLLQREGSPEAIRRAYAPAIEAYRDMRRKHLRLYPTVLEGLVELRSKGCLVVGYTESLAFYSKYRLRHLGLDGILDYLFSPRDHEFPARLPTEAVTYYKERALHLRHTIHRHTPDGELKPNPKLLADIVTSVGATTQQAIYVGDKLHKDVLMAKRANVMDVHAAYGESHQRKEYELLKRVTHWTPDMVNREATLTKEVVRPTHAIQAFLELIKAFSFNEFSGHLSRE